MGNIDTQARTGSTCTLASRLTGAGIATILVLTAASCSSDSKTSSPAPAIDRTAATTAASTAGTIAAAATTAAPYAETADTTAGSTAESTAATIAVADTVDGAVSGGGTATTDGATVGEDVSLQGASPFGTALAITASVSVQVADVRHAVNALPAIVAANGGAIFDSEVSVGDPATATATITVKVPPPGLEDLVSGLGGLGELTSRNQQAEDVADQLSDTQNRIAAAQASVDRVRFLLAGAVDIDAVIRIEGELTIRETALEQLLAVERNVTDKVQLATLTIVFSPKPVVVAAPVVPPPALIDVGAKVQPSSASARALIAGWHGFTAVLRGIVVGLAYSLPVLILLLLVGAVLWIVRRIRRASRRRQPAVIPAE
ncbi:MAG: lipoprotein [Acidimicrobiales bacterium]|nr:lipoprotein [Acidimicrobiales bacterium]